MQYVVSTLYSLTLVVALNLSSQWQVALGADDTKDHRFNLTPEQGQGLAIGYFALACAETAALNYAEKVADINDDALRNQMAYESKTHWTIQYMIPDLFLINGYPYSSYDKISKAVNSITLRSMQKAIEKTIKNNKDPEQITSLIISSAFSSIFCHKKFIATIYQVLIDERLLLKHRPIPIRYTKELIETYRALIDQSQIDPLPLALYQLIIYHFFTNTPFDKTKTLKQHYESMYRSYLKKCHPLYEFFLFARTASSRKLDKQRVFAANKILDINVLTFVKDYLGPILLENGNSKLLIRSPEELWPHEETHNNSCLIM